VTQNTALWIRPAARVLVVDAKDRGRRFALRRSVERTGAALNERARDRLRERLAQYEVLGVVLTSNTAKTKGMSQALSEAGFHWTDLRGPYRLWLRDGVSAAGSARE